MRHILFIITTLFIIASCKPKENLLPASFEVLLPDTSKTHSSNMLFDYLRNYARQMNLPRIDTGIKGFELRIWTGSMLDPDQMILVRKSDSGIIGQKFDYTSYSYNLDSYTLKENYQNKAITQLVDSLQMIDFRGMISQNEIPNFIDGIADGITYHLEVATPTYYKLVTYHCPEHFGKIENNSKKFLDLLLLIDNHIKFYPSICSLSQSCDSSAVDNSSFPHTQRTGVKHETEFIHLSPLG
jgi:hypothetical protein